MYAPRCHGLHMLADVHLVRCVEAEVDWYIVVEHTVKNCEFSEVFSLGNFLNFV